MKTVSVIFQGNDPVNLSRFGLVTKGTPIPLNIREAQDVAKDSRFKRSDKDLFPLVYQPGKVAPNESDDDTRARLHADAQRAALYDRLNTQFEANEKPEKP